MSRPPLLEALRNRVLLCDGGMGSRVQALTLDIDNDYWGKENCTEVLNLSRPDLVREIHRGYYEAGADMVLTNSFGGSPVTLAEFELEDRAFEIDKASRRAGARGAETFADGRDRWVIGDIGPGTKLPSLGHIGYDALEAALAVQCRGLIAGGADALLTETNQDTLHIKAAVNAAKAALKQTGKRHPDLRAGHGRDHRHPAGRAGHRRRLRPSSHSLDVPLIGLNCAHRAAGDGGARPLPQPELARADRVQPNAGLPELVDGKTHYPLGAAEMASWMERFVREDGVNLIGGCCGTSDAAYRGAGRDAAPARPRTASADAGGAEPRGSPRSPRSTARAAAPGERLFLHRRALQRQWLEGLARTPGGA